MTDKEEKRLAEELRSRLRLTHWNLEFSDEEILKATEKSFLQARIRLGFALSDLWIAIKKKFQ